MSAALALKEFSPRLALPLAANDNDGQTIYTIYNRAGELVHVDDLTTGTKTDYVRLSGRTVARVENKITPTYVHGDHLGSPVSRSNASGTLLPRERYTPFGITLNNPNDLNNQAGFTATAVAFSTYNRFPKPIIWLRQPFPKQIKDSATGLNYMQARYYDPVIGRFLSIDPVTFMDTGSPSYFNRYRYCSNDPVNCTDPTGMSDAFGTTDSILFEVVAYAFQPVIDALDPRTIPDDIATTIDEVKRGDLSGAALSAGGVAFRPLKGAKGALKGSAGGGQELVRSTLERQSEMKYRLMQRPMAELQNA